MKLSERCQGQKTPRQYIDEVQELTMAIPDEWDQSVVSMFARGITDPVARRS